MVTSDPIVHIIGGWQWPNDSNHLGIGLRIMQCMCKPGMHGTAFFASGQGGAEEFFFGVGEGGKGSNPRGGRGNSQTRGIFGVVLVDI